MRRQRARYGRQRKQPRVRRHRSLCHEHDRKQRDRIASSIMARLWFGCPGASSHRPRRTAAQLDTNPPLHNVMLLVDSSGSMEYANDGSAVTCDQVDPISPLRSPPGPSQKNRWMQLVEVLTGDVKDTGCYSQDRSTTMLSATSTSSARRCPTTTTTTFPTTASSRESGASDVHHWRGRSRFESLRLGHRRRSSTTSDRTIARAACDQFHPVRDRTARQLPRSACASAS